ncbi:hypothetical protein VTK73DRAFT_279 [Phialemonium thermophilum]|uniref:RZ-type domain-containing protein n=1 Tax=Phialemonium thermophilum TaxID=223376 RepID=A0ABR3VW20_9PEZI
MQNVLFCSVAAARRPSAAENSDPADGEPPQPPPAQPTLWGDRRRASVPLHLADPAEHNIASALQWPVDGLNGGNRALVLVEFPGVLLASFQATLATLQDMFRAPQLPFVDLLVPDDTKNGEALSIPPPQYARRPGFAFDLREITTNHDHAQPPLWFRPGDADLDAHVRRLVDSSSLDPSQARAVLESLSRELALIEGPPGTGKSYTGEAIIKTLLATNRNRNGTEAGLGPILLVCYTNHALDQLMEHLHRGGVEGMIRIGGQSQSDVLQDINLRVVARDARKTAIEMDQIRACKRLVETGKQRMHHLLGQLQRCHSAEGLREYLKEHHGTSYSAIFGDGDDDGDGDGDDDNEDVWVQVGRRRHNHPSSRLGRWLHGGGSRTETTTTSPRENNVALEEAELSDVVLEETETNPWSLSPRERERLYRHWQERHRRTLADQILAAHEAWRSARAQMDCVHREVDGRCLRQAQVIGVTTTGLARHVELLRKLRCKVVVCEEAGEVLEAHLLTALLPSVEHAILIGDHLQLRPQIQDYSLQTVNPAGAKYALDVSLFERLVRPFADHTPALPYSTLLTQRRMHPDIARLVRETLYPDLEDAVAVARYPPVAGMRQRLFWLHHEHEEQGRNSSGSGDDPTSTSVSNEWEAAMALELVAYLTRQGAYKPGDIAVLVPYLAQLRLLRRVFEGRFEVLLNDRDAGDLEEEADEPDAPEPGTSVGEEARPPKAPLAKASLSRSVRLATVDNFQGEEAQVVVVSLVRSNRENRPGFLRVSNRINVLLSRARHGLFILGNAHTAAAVDMWARVLRILKENKPGSFGTALELRCARHPEARLLVREPGDFARLAPDGGCHLPCDRRLDCGHRCAGRCHADHLHRVFRCVEPCSRRRRGGGCDHPCPRECGQPCEDNCSLLLRDLDLPLPCGHRVTSAPCWQAQDPSSIQCRVLVEKTVPGCGHVVSVACHVNVEGPDYACLAECAAVLPCGHQCRQKCILCQPARSHPTHDETTTPPPAPPPVMHGPCRAICGRGYTTCKHTCQEACHDGVGCPPCRAPCEVRCSHSRCPKRCHEPCAVCAEEDCSSRCPHSQCSLPCAAPCDWVPCSRRCEKTLACGHQCPSLCGETCPDVKFCQTCAPSDVRGTVVDLLEMREYSEVNLDEEPCLFLACGHIFTRTTLDGQMDLSQHYTLSAEGHPVAVAPASRRSSVDPVKLCPECRGPLRSLSRYGRIIRQAMLDELTKRYVAWSHTEFTLLGSALLDARSQLGSSSSSSRPAQELLPTAGGRAGQLDIRGSPSDVVRVVSEWTGHGYFRSVLVVRRRIEAYARKVRVEEQPLWRVAELVAHARRNQSAGGADMPPVDESQLQTSGSVKAAALLLRCDLFVLTEFMRLWQTVRDAQAAIQMDLSGHKERCAALIAAAEKQSRHQHTVEGYVFLAQCCTLERCVQPHDGAGSAASDARRRNADLQHEAQGALETARRVSRQYPATTEAVQCDIEATAKMVQGLGFYAPVSDEELRSIYHAVGFSTGHWYECENGHLFVVGECGMPMELARCHECGRPVGGQNHDPAHGVRRAHELEEMATGVRAVDLDA